jgi:hypothetical protein
MNFREPLRAAHSFLKVPFGHSYGSRPPFSQTRNGHRREVPPYRASASRWGSDALGESEPFVQTHRGMHNRRFSGPPSTFPSCQSPSRFLRRITLGRGSYNSCDQLYCFALAS